MTRYIFRRLLQTVPVLLGVSLLAFAIMHVVPGDPVRLIAGPDAPESVVGRVRVELGLERPLHVQYLSFLGRALRGDLGRSLRSRAPVIEEIFSRFPATLELTTVSMLLAVVVGIPLGLVAAVRRASWLDYLAMGASLSTLSMPIFWVAIVAIWLFSLQLGWLPVSGRAGPVWEWEGLRHMVLPAATLATTSLAIISRLTRSGMLDVLGREYVTTARAKGVPPFRALMKYPLRMALNPFISDIGSLLPHIISGAAVVSVVLSLPTTGPMLLEALRSQDMYLAGSFLMFMATLTVIGMFISDLALAALDPRIRLSGGVTR
jgi:peptide/nickel transport system permease protein